MKILKMIIVFASYLIFTLSPSMAFVDLPADPVSDSSLEKNTPLHDMGSIKTPSPEFPSIDSQTFHNTEGIEGPTLNLSQEFQVAWLGPISRLIKMLGTSALSGAVVGCTFGAFKANEDNTLSIGEALNIIETLQTHGLIENISPEDIDKVKSYVHEYGLEKLHAESLHDSAIYGSFVGTYSSLFYSARSFLKATGVFLSTLGGLASIGIGAAGGLAGGAIGSLSCENAVQYLLQNDLVDIDHIDEEVKARLRESFDNLSVIINKMDNFDDFDFFNNTDEPQT